MNASAAPFFSATTDARTCAVVQGDFVRGVDRELERDCPVAEDDAGASAGFVQPSLAVLPKYILRGRIGDILRGCTVME